MGSNQKKFLKRFSKGRAKTASSMAPVMNAMSPTVPDSYFPNVGSTALPVPMEPIVTHRYNTGTWYTLKERIGRVQLLAFSLIWGILFSILLLADLLVMGINYSELIINPNNDVGLLANNSTSLLLLALMLVVLVFTVIILPRRRLHDIGESGWWLVLLFIPFANFYILYLLYLKAGDATTNKYGKPPLPHSKVERILAIMVPIFSLLSIVLMVHASNAALSTVNTQNIEGDNNIQTLTAPVSPNDATLSDNADSTNQSDIQNTDDDVIANELDAETAAQVQNVIDNATNAQAVKITYAQFLKESSTKIYVDKSSPAPTAVEADVFVEDNKDDNKPQ